MPAPSGVPSPAASPTLRRLLRPWEPPASNPPHDPAPSEPRDAELPIKARPSLEEECAAGSDRLGCDCASDARGPLEARAREPERFGALDRLPGLTGGRRTVGES